MAIKIAQRNAPYRFERIAECSRCLLLAPRLMLERGLQFTKRCS